MLKCFSCVFVVFVLFVGFFVGMVYVDQLVINFGIIFIELLQNFKSIWEFFFKDMSQQIGYQVKVFFVFDYVGIIQGMCFDKVDIVWYGNKVVMEVVDCVYGEIFVQIVVVSGVLGYWSLLIVNKDSKIDSFEDMLVNVKSLIFGNGDLNFMFGYLVFGYYVFVKNNVDLVKVFKCIFNFSYEVNVLVVVNKQVDVVIFNIEGMECLELIQLEKVRQFKVIWKLLLILGDLLVWCNNLSDEQKNKLCDFFFKYGVNVEQKKVFVDL